MSDLTEEANEVGNSLRQAARSGDDETVAAILKQLSTQPNDNAIRNVLSTSDEGSGNTALHFCSANGHLQLVKILLDHGAPINAANLAGSTPLHYAALTGERDVVQTLLTRGAAPVVENSFSKTALDEALRAPHREVADLLIRHVENKAKANETADKKT